MDAIYVSAHQECKHGRASAVAVLSHKDENGNVWLKCAKTACPSGSASKAAREVCCSALSMYKQPVQASIWTDNSALAVDITNREGPYGKASLEAWLDYHNIGYAMYQDSSCLSAGTEDEDERMLLNAKNVAMATFNLMPEELDQKICPACGKETMQFQYDMIQEGKYMAFRLIQAKCKACGHVIQIGYNTPWILRETEAIQL